MQEQRKDAVLLIGKIASGYDSARFKTTVDSFSRLFEELETVITTFGREYKHVNDIIYDLKSFRAESIDKRTSLDRKIKASKTISAIILLEPRKQQHSAKLQEK